MVLITSPFITPVMIIIKLKKTLKINILLIKIEMQQTHLKFYMK